MKKQSRILIITNLLLLLGYLNWSIYQKEQTLRDGQLVLFELAPVDPRSLMQGDYMSLRLFLGAESFFFEEGQDTLYQKATYGGLKVNAKGESLLVGLYDKDFLLIKPDR